MKFKISGNLQWGNIFSKKIDIPMSCELNLAPGYYLIYADLLADDRGQGLDIGAMFNRAFGIALPTNVFVVKHAGFFTFSARSDNEADHDVKVIDIFPNAPIPASIKKQIGTVTNTTSFWTRVEFSSSKLFSTLIDVGYENRGNIALVGTFASQVSAAQTIQTTEYMATLDYIKLLSLFEFSDLILIYRFDQAAEYRISGTLCLTLFGTERYCFKGSVISTETTLKACIRSANSEAVIENPFFSQMRGVTFKNLLFGISYRYANDEHPESEGLFRIQGSVEYGGLAFTGQLYLHNTDPILASVAIDKDLNIGAIFSQSILLHSWPTDFINIVFFAGSRLYYQAPQSDHQRFSELAFVCASETPEQANQELVPSETVEDDISYLDGFNIYARFQITLLLSIDLFGTITIKDNGVAAQIQLANQINLYVLQIISPNLLPDQHNHAAAGPVFCFDSATNTMGFECGLWFFQQDFGLSTTLEGTKDQDDNKLALKGSLRSQRAFPPFLTESVELGFSYDQQDGFQVTNWPMFHWFSDAIDFVKQIQDIGNSGSPGCGDIVDFVNEQFLRTDFQISPAFDSQGQRLYLVLNGAYVMSFTFGGETTEFLRLDFPNAVRVLLPDDISFDSLGSAINGALGSAASSFVQGLLDNAEAISIFLAIMAGERVFQYALTLVCNNIISPSVPGAAQAGGAGFSGAGGLSGGQASIAIVGTIISGMLSRSCFVAGTQVKLADGSEMDIENIQIGDVLLGQDNSENQVLAFDRPVLAQRLLYSFNSGPFFVTQEHPFLTPDGWKSLNPSATQRENSQLVVDLLQLGDYLYLADGSCELLISIESQSGKHDTPLYNFMLSNNKSYFANGYLAHNKDPDPDPDSGDKLYPPADVVLRYEKQTVTANWQAAAGAKMYSLNFYLPDESRSLSLEVPYDHVSKVIPITAEDPDGLYRFTIASVRDQDTSDTNQATITRVKPPRLQISLDSPSDYSADPSLLLSWNATPAASAYTLVINAVEIVQDAQEVCQRSQIFTDDQPEGPYAFSIAVMSGGDFINSVFSSTQVWHRLEQAVDVSVNVSGTIAQIRWYTSVSMMDFVVRIVTEDAQESTYFTVTDNALTVDLSLLDHSNQFFVAVRTLTSDAIELAPVIQQIPSRWTDPVMVDLTTSPDELAKYYFAAGFNGIECARRIKAQFPQLSSETMAVAMAQAGFASQETANGLKDSYSGISATTLASALAVAYGKTPLLPMQLAALSFANQFSGIQCARLLISRYPQLSSEVMAVAMAQADFLPQETASGLKDSYLGISATVLANVLVAAYGKVN